jgi:hypothetical protein
MAVSSITASFQSEYAIDSKTDLGAVISDFPGREERLRWRLGHRFTQETKGAHNLYLRVAFGDIVILKYRQPAPPGPLTH